MNQRIFPITMPKWGIEMQQGTITEWHATPGSRCKKARNSSEWKPTRSSTRSKRPSSGLLRLIIADVGATENVGALIAVFAEPSVSDAEIQAFVRDFKAADARFESEDLVSTDNAASSPPPPAPGVEPVEGEARISPDCTARSGASRHRPDPGQRHRAQRQSIQGRRRSLCRRAGQHRGCPSRRDAERSGNRRAAAHEAHLDAQRDCETAARIQAVHSPLPGGGGCRLCCPRVSARGTGGRRQRGFDQ